MSLENTLKKLWLQQETLKTVCALSVTAAILGFGLISCTSTSENQSSSALRQAEILPPAARGMQLDLAESYDDKQAVYRASNYRILDIPDVGSFYVPAHLLKRIRINWTVARAKLKSSPKDAGSLRTLATYELLMGNPSGAKTYIEIARSAGKGFDVDSSMLLGLSELALGNLKRAQSEFARCEAEKAGATLAQINLGLYALSFGNAKQAVFHFGIASSRDSKNVIALIHLGQSYYLTRQFEKSVESFDRALKIDSGNSLALYNRGVVLHRGLRHFGRARDSLEEVVSSETASVNLKKKASGALQNLDRDEQGKENLATIGVF